MTDEPVGEERWLAQLQAHYKARARQGEERPTAFSRWCEARRKDWTAKANGGKPDVGGAVRQTDKLSGRS